MAKQQAPDLAVSVARAAGAMRQAMSHIINDDPQCPDWLMDFEKELKKFEYMIHHDRYKPCYYRREVFFDGSDLR